MTNRTNNFETGHVVINRNDMVETGLYENSRRHRVFDEIWTREEACHSRFGKNSRLRTRTLIAALTRDGYGTEGQVKSTLRQLQRKGYISLLNS